MYSQNGLLAFQSIIGNIAIPPIAEIQLETLRLLILDSFFFGVFDAEKGEISPEDPLHFLMLELFFLGPSEVFDVMVEVLVIGSDELLVLTLFA